MFIKIEGKSFHEIFDSTRLRYKRVNTRKNELLEIKEVITEVIFGPIHDQAR